SLRTRLPPRPTLLPYTTLFRSRNRSRYRIHVSLLISLASNLACCGLAPPFPHTYKFQPFSVAIIPKSLLCASAHSRTEPLTADLDRKSTRLNSSHVKISYAVFC